MNKRVLELLAPAKDLECGIAAIECGADAVYIGASRFGARAAAGNSLEDIAALIHYAHTFRVKVYSTVNTILFNNELNEARSLINKLYDIGIDAVIFQDTALLQMSLPPVPLFASTQMHNYDMERIRFLDSLGIKRIILARELSIEQIKEMKNSVSAELEFFIHGALCVCLSGQCYMSAFMSGRSANRGECAQPCRLQYSLIDRNGKVIVSNKHLLSLRDLNLSIYINELINAGITSFKIEGRLKDVGYVKNVTAYYRQKLDSIIQHNTELRRASSGISKIPFVPDPERTFNRGYTSYFISGRDEQLASVDTPKSVGKYLGNISHIDSTGFTINTAEALANGDGLCFFDASGELLGIRITRFLGNTVFTRDLKGLGRGTKIYRNYDQKFSNDLKKECVRKIRVTVDVKETEDGLNIEATDEDGICACYNVNTEKLTSERGKNAYETFITQFSKSGGTSFVIERVNINFSTPLFFTVKTINGFRRSVLNLLEKEREKSYKRGIFTPGIKIKPLSYNSLDYRWNVVNKLSKQFYERHGALKIEEGFELQNNYSGKTLMTCKYCIKDQLGCCTDKTDIRFEEPLYLTNNNKKYRLVFNCRECLMQIICE